MFTAAKMLGFIRIIAHSTTVLRPGSTSTKLLGQARLPLTVDSLRSIMTQPVLRPSRMTISSRLNSERGNLFLTTDSCKDVAVTTHLNSQRSASKAHHSWKASTSTSFVMVKPLKQSRQVLAQKASFQFLTSPVHLLELTHLAVKFGPKVQLVQEGEAH